MTTLVLGDSNFTMNEAMSGGGVCAMGHCTVNATSCMWMHNGADMSGGGIKVGDTTSLMVSTCYLYNNSANDGGGVYAAEGSMATAIETVWEQNRAVMQGGGVMGNGSTTVQLYTCTFTMNTATDGA
eukprot:36296-Rhodomonas_salina.1